MSPAESSKEEIILQRVKQALTAVIKDTATQPGMIHPLSETTIDRLRDCLILISDREKELAEAAGRPLTQRPRFTDERPARQDVIVPIDTLTRKGTKNGNGE